MAVWTYKAVPLSSGQRDIRSGEVSGETAADVRAALRRIDLQVVELKQLRSRSARSADGDVVFGDLRAHAEAYLRSRRGPAKAELYDSLATMLEGGIPFADALSVMKSAAPRGSQRRLLALMTDAVRGGEDPSEAMSHLPTWFDAAEVAMVNAGRHSGELPGVLRSLAERRARSGELGGKIAAALTYPAVVLMLGLAVVIFLSAKTLPDLVSILEAERVEPPRLTSAVMWFGQTMFGLAPMLPVIFVAILGVTLGGRFVLKRSHITLPFKTADLAPRVIRRAAVAEALLAIAELSRAGVTLVDAMRVVAPTVRGPGSGGLRTRLTDAANRIESGASLAEALDDRRWFDEEFIQLVRVGESGGDLEAVLERVGQRYRRSAQRMIERIASLLEPAAILGLAVCVGIVVLAAVLPLLQLQEVLR
ncbi:MAG: type II secretion system F family protein [Planctomycetota bacterium]